MVSRSHTRAWNDWGVVNPLYAILTHPKFRHGGPVAEFLDSGEGTVATVLAEVSRLGLCPQHRAALDFGCGVGRLTIPLTRRFEEVTGVDVAPSMLDEARRLHGDVANCRFVRNTASGLPWVPDASIDLVLCLLVLQHLDSAAAIEHHLGEFVRVLRPRGAAVVQLPTHVPAHKPPLPPATTRAGARARAAMALRRLGVPAQVLYDRLDWVPQMTLLALPDERVRATVERSGGRICHATDPETDAGGTVDRTYYITR